MRQPIPPSSEAATPWHSLTHEDALARLSVERERGLSAQAAAARLREYGPNALPKRKPVPVWRRFLLQFHNILIYVLLAAAAGALFVGDRVDAAAILAVTVINAVIGFVQESKAEDALDAIRDLLSLSAAVLRDGRRESVPAECLAPGDIVFLEAGDKAPADLRLLDCKNLTMDESALTGESVPAEKSSAAVAPDMPLGDRRCMVYAGTLAARGQALGVTVATGAATELGRVNALTNRVGVPETPLQRRLTRFGHWLTAFILAFAAATFCFGTLARGLALEDMFMAMVGIAVAAIPEGLPAVVTITLAAGVARMARRKAIVRHLPAVETLGSVTTICSDKTGTLTRNEMTVCAAIGATREFALDAGIGDGFRCEGLTVKAADHPDLLELVRAALLCNDAEIVEDDGARRVNGDPTEIALLDMAAQAGVDRRETRRAYARLDAIPFESERRYMASLHRGPSGERAIFLKGAPEAVLERCDGQREAGRAAPLRSEYWRERVQDLAAGGRRVLALAMKPAPEDKERLGQEDAEYGFAMLGLCGMIDPPRQEAMRAVDACREAGIRVRMITGDHGVTARAVAAMLGIDARRVLTGADIEALPEREFAAAVQDCEVFARTSPEHKLRLVEALQAEGGVVAMTGDGVNDSPALKRADIGVAMGLRGSEAAKEAAVMVLADDNFATVVSAVEEGRTVYDNLKKAIVFTLPTSFGQAGAIVAGILLGQTLPISPVQILWVNLVTAVTLSLAFSFEPPEPDIMRRPPRDPREPLLDGFLIWRVLFVSLLLVGGSLGLFLLELQAGASLETARTAAVNALIAGEIGYLFNSRFIRASALTPRALAGAPYAWLAIAVIVALQASLTYLPTLQRAFGTAALDAQAWRPIAAFGLLLFLAVELEKLLTRALMRGREQAVPARAPERPAALDRKGLTAYAWLSISAAVLTIGLKTWAWRLTGSVGLLSDALESLVNLATAVIALCMLMLAAKPPDDEHHFGHGKAEYFAGGLEGAFILVAAVGIGWAGVERLLAPQALRSVDTGLAVSAAAALINLGVASVLLRAGRRYGSIALEADARHLLTDVWTSGGVLLGVGAVALTGWPPLDPIVALLVALNIVWTGVNLLRRAVDGLLDATLPEAENARIDAILDRYRAQGLQFHDLRTRHSGTCRYLTVHVLAPGEMTIKAGHDWVERVEADIRAELGEIVVLTHLEPLGDPASYRHGENGETDPGRLSLIRRRSGGRSSSETNR